MTAFGDAVGGQLKAAGETFIQRNAVYNDNYKRVGQVMRALFPEGVELKTSEDFERWHILELMVVKLTRYTNNWETTGGHPDSLEDLSVYSAMLMQIDVDQVAVQEENERILAQADAENDMGF